MMRTPVSQSDVGATRAPDVEGWLDGPAFSPMPPTLAQVTALIAVVNLSVERAAAHSLGISIATLRCELHELYQRLGVKNRVGAVMALWSVIGRQLLPKPKPPRPFAVPAYRDRRSGIERRTHA